MSDLGCTTDPVGISAGPGQDVHRCYGRLTCSQSNGKTIVIRQVASSSCCPVAKQLIWGGASRHVLEGGCFAIPVFCSPEQASSLVLVLNIAVVPVSTSRPLHLMCWCIWSFPLVALVENQRQSPIPPVCVEPAAILLATGIWYFVCSTNLMLKKTSQSMSGWHCCVPVSRSSHQRPAIQLNSKEVKEQHKLVLLRLYRVFVAPDFPGWGVCAAADCVLKRWERGSLSQLPRAL